MASFKIPFETQLDSGAKKLTAVTGALALAVGMGFGGVAAFANDAENVPAGDENKVVENLEGAEEKAPEVENNEGAEEKAPEVENNTPAEGENNEGAAEGDDNGAAGNENDGAAEGGNDGVAGDDNGVAGDENNAPAEGENNEGAAEGDENDGAAEGDDTESNELEPVKFKIKHFEQQQPDGTWNSGSITGYSEGDRVPMRVELRDLVAGKPVTVTVGFDYMVGAFYGYQDPQLASNDDEVTMGKPVINGNLGSVVFTITPKGETAFLNFTLQLSHGERDMNNGASNIKGAPLHARIDATSSGIGDGNHSLPIHKIQWAPYPPEPVDPETPEPEEPENPEPEEPEEPETPEQVEPEPEETTPEATTEAPTTQKPTAEKPAKKELAKTGIDGSLAGIAALFAVAGAAALVTRRNATR